MKRDRVITVTDVSFFHLKKFSTIHMSIYTS
uniref:Uncharacterized protein n=1 Tax=Anguilla anguilla TaxID=7936 RepID=A0A0E9W715_ANGAN